jgi:hypothetical protein
VTVKLSVILPTVISPGKDLAADFGPAFGTWLREGDTSAWAQLHGLSATSILTGDLDGNGIDDILIDFGPSYGIWVWVNNTSWFQLHPATGNQMVA